MKKFIAAIKKIKIEEDFETTGEALDNFLTIADILDFTDWRCEDLNDISVKVMEYRHNE